VKNDKFNFTNDMLNMIKFDKSPLIF